MGFLELLSSLPQVRDAVVATTTVRDVAPRTIPVRRVGATVTALATEVSMMVMPAARVLWCAGVTTVSSSELTTTRRTTAVRSHHLLSRFPSLRSPKDRSSKVGDPGQTGELAATP